MTIVLIGNKKDKASDREVSYEEGVQFAKQHNLIFFETSAKTSENVEKCFTHAAKLIYANIQRGDVYDLANDSVGIKPGNNVSSRGSDMTADLNNVDLYALDKKHKLKKKGCC